MPEQASIDGRTARRDRNRLAVLDAVLDLFAAGDLSPSAEAVAARSGVSLRSVYRYFADSDDLVRAAVERHLEKVGPLFLAGEASPAGPATFDERVDRFVAARMRLYAAVAPTARAARLRAELSAGPASEILRRRLATRRRLLRSQLEKQFEAEIAALGGHAFALVAAADALTQLESVDWMLTGGGYTEQMTRDALAAALRRLLSAGDRPALSRRSGRT